MKCIRRRMKNAYLLRSAHFCRPKAKGQRRKVRETFRYQPPLRPWIPAFAGMTVILPACAGMTYSEEHET